MRWKSIQSIRRGLKGSTLEDYIKSVYANKYALTGYISAVACAGMIYALHAAPGDTSEMISFGLAKGLTGTYAFLTLTQTMFGITTLVTYKRAKNQLQKFGKFPKEYSRLREHYCDEVGLELAIKESGLEKAAYS